MMLYQDSYVMRREFKYGITVTDEVFTASDMLLSHLFRDRKVFAVVDSAVQHTTVPAIGQYFAKHGITYHLVVIPGGESCKTLQVSEDLAKNVLRSGIDRGDCMLAVGGGALLDLVGYVAHRVHRGIPHMNVPTTFLAQVDAGVGIKNAINFDGYKNTLGSFQPPEHTIVDLSYLKSLATRDLRSGLAEAIKVAIILNRELFDLLEQGIRDVLNLEIENGRVPKIVHETIIAHVSQIALDPFELLPERPLVFGHEWAHWLEIQTKHALSHGEAVALGVLIDSNIAHRRGLLASADLQRISLLIREAGLPVFHDWLRTDLSDHCGVLYKGLERHQQHQYGEESLIALPRGIGVPEYVSDITREEVIAAVAAMERIE